MMTEHIFSPAPPALMVIKNSNTSRLSLSAVLYGPAFPPSVLSFLSCYVCNAVFQQSLIVWPSSRFSLPPLLLCHMVRRMNVWRCMCGCVRRRIPEGVVVVEPKVVCGSIRLPLVKSETAAFGCSCASLTQMIPAN